jgi:hypothetical protein
MVFYRYFALFYFRGSARDVHEFFKKKSTIPALGHAAFACRIFNFPAYYLLVGGLPVI